MTFCCPTRSFLPIAAVALVLLALPAFAIDVPDQLPDPDGSSAATNEPVKVFILLGQSNMLGFGKISGADKPGTLEHATGTEQLYPYLVDEAGKWTERMDVRNVRVMGSGRGLALTGRAVGNLVRSRRNVTPLLKEAVGGIVVMRYGENAQKTIDGVKDKLAQLSASLPEGVEMDDPQVEIPDQIVKNDTGISDVRRRFQW